MNQFFDVQKQKQNDSSLLRWYGFPSPPHPLLHVHQKLGGGKRKWTGHLCSCDVMWSDGLHWGGAFCTGATHTANMVSSRIWTVYSPTVQGSSRRCSHSCWRKVLGGTCQSCETLWFCYISLLTSICPGGCSPNCSITEHPKLISVCNFGQVTWTSIHLLIHSMNIFWVSSVCQTLYWVSKSRPGLFSSWVMDRWALVMFNYS